MSKLVLFNKPYLVLCQFTDEKNSGDPRQTLADFIDLKGVYAAGRLDLDSEGLLLLTDNGALQHRIAHPARKMQKTYWVQVEGEIDEEALQKLRHGVALKDGLTAPAQATPMAAPEIWPRFPPIRERKKIPTSWLSLSLTEGKNRQVRRMTAAVGLPTLRLIRYQIGEWNLGDLMPGEFKVIDL